MLLLVLLLIGYRAIDGVEKRVAEKVQKETRMKDAALLGRQVERRLLVAVAQMSLRLIRQQERAHFRARLDHRLFVVYVVHCKSVSVITKNKYVRIA